MTNNGELFLQEESGQGLAEYGLILAFIALAVFLALGSLGNAINSFYQDFAGLF
ncbi:MAG: Flp/Fap pilin component [Pelotomaculum thermopropionicum]|uniref:Flp/Fap pilin component n=1 Tax=Pelotomaculum thermopropionicum TaxID=110500 RepID=A0A117M4N5_9FIRM|nr:MAG: Flp/Fap pilin component [Pelotomaculum thermopropionicum]